jgi:phosphatidate cytidylyltransferase
MIARIFSALILVPAVLALVIYAPEWLLLVAVGIVGTLCLWEYSTLAKAMGTGGQLWFAVAAFWILLLGFRGNWIPAPALLAVAFLGVFLAAMWRRLPVRERALGLLGDTLGVVYVVVGLFPIVPIRFDFGHGGGLRWLILLFAVTWAGDIAAMFCGKHFGRTRFAPVLSPKKTNEGAIAGLTAGLVIALLLQRYLMRDFPLLHVVAVALLAGTLGQLGDLAESMLKRGAGVKDSSALIPGHGGVLDRIDSLMFGLPTLYVYLSVLYRQ